ncbi:MAG TPA: BBP7 family outer membrane beta-barrel protein, partial [Acetobacteraceae bacterium]|nr:BBP7 family outer membrane beta-barrel protein [Acetobacteraceae bacterium]
RQGFSGGPKIRLTYHDDSGYGFELTYFNVFNQTGTETIGPDNPASWFLMRAPGGFWQTQDFPYQAMAWSNTTNLYSAEANMRLELLPRVTALAGFRWLQLNDNLQGTLTPSDRTAPSWKTSCPLCNVFQITPDGPIGNLPPFWNGGTTNNLYGVQVGIDADILRFDRFSLGGRATIGLFDNNARQSTGVSIEKVVYPSTATANGAAFVSEAGLQLKYRVTNGLSLKAGYEVLWLVGVALAPGQIEKTHAAPADVQALGVNHGSNVLFQGATFGLEYSF